MKLRIEIDEEAPEEIVIRAKSADARLRRLQTAIEGALGSRELAVKKADEECFLPFAELLYFETSDKTAYVHTVHDCFVCPLHLNELERLLPAEFVRCSKSAIINTQLIRSLIRYPTGIAKASFKGSDKYAYVSRMYYKIVRDTIEEMRL